MIKTALGASKFLSDLPSRGHLSSTIISSNLVEQVSGVDGASGRTAPARMGRATVAEQVKGQKQGGMRVYICEHNTSPPENQHIKTDQQNILIRSLMLNNNKGGSSSKDVKAAAEGPRKRFAHQSSMVKKYINVNDEVSVVAALVLHTKRNDVVSEGSRKNNEEKEGLKSANDDVEGEEKKIEEDYE